MNKKRTFIVVGILLATILLGVGYALSNTTLTINASASATATDSNFKVHLTEVSEKSDPTNVEASITDDLTASITVKNLVEVGDFETATYTIKNDSIDLKANLSASEVTSANGYFKITTSFESASLAAQSSTKATVKVELIKTPLENKTETFSLNIIAQPVEAN